MMNKFLLMKRSVNGSYCIPKRNFSAIKVFDFY